ncbi:hypothetical protein ACI79D_11055 [Geodermatophilus sp. SYSU D00708]
MRRTWSAIAQVRLAPVRLAPALLAPALLAPVLLASACGHGATAGGAASCVGLQLVGLSPDRGAALTSTELTVEWLREGCNDHGGADEERARRDVPVYFVREQTNTRVGTVTGSGDRYRATLRFQVPDTATPGPALLYLGDPSTGSVLGTFTVE